jgi:hypothetical protein
MATATAPVPILDLTTNIVRPVVRIDGAAYELRVADDLSLLEYKILERLCPRAGDLLIQDTLTDAEGAELSRLLDEACRLALVAPDAVHAKLKDVARARVFDAFTELLQVPSLTAGATLATPLAGTKSSPVSPGSTVASRTRGSRRSR